MAADIQGVVWTVKEEKYFSLGGAHANEMVRQQLKVSCRSVGSLVKKEGQVIKSLTNKLRVIPMNWPRLKFPKWSWPKIVDRKPAFYAGAFGIGIVLWYLDQKVFSGIPFLVGPIVFVWVVLGLYRRIEQLELSRNEARETIRTLLATIAEKDGEATPAGE